MASGNQRPERPAQGSAAGMRIGIVRAVWNPSIVERLAAGVQRGLSELGVCDITEVTVPGCFEIPLATQMLARRHERHGVDDHVHAIVAIGAVIRGETTHYELVSESAANGVMTAQLATSVPVGFGVLTVENEQQALARSEGPGGHNVGEDAAYVAVTMALLARDLKAQRWQISARHPPEYRQ